MTEAAEKKDVQKLQRIIVDALEDVKAVDIAVYNTEHLSSLFERVILASGTSNRQTKALAANVRDEVRKSGHGKPRIEGEENGEWIIVDCGPAVVHIMQPNIREYYHLEEIWGDKPVRLKFGAPKPVFAKAEEPAPKKTAKKSATSSSKAAPGKGGAKSSAKSSAKSTRTSKSNARGLKTTVDPKTGLTVPVNNSRRAIDKRPYLAELPAESPKAKPSTPLKGAKKTASSTKAPAKSTARATTQAPRKAPAKAAAPASAKPASKAAPKAVRAAPAKKTAAKKTTQRA